MSGGKYRYTKDIDKLLVNAKEELDNKKLEQASDILGQAFDSLSRNNLDNFDEPGTLQTQAATAIDLYAMLKKAKEESFDLIQERIKQGDISDTFQAIMAEMKKEKVHRKSCLIT